MSFYTSNSRNLLKLYGLTLVFFLLFLAFTSEHLVRNYIKPLDNFNHHTKLFKTSTAKNIAIGDSHVARGFFPPKDMINLAFPSEGVEHFKWKVQSYFKDRPIGDVIIQADPHLFAPYRIGNRLGDYAANFNDKQADNLMISTNRHRPQIVAYWQAFFTTSGTLRSKVKWLDNGTLLSSGDLSLKGKRYQVYEARSRVLLHAIQQRPALQDRIKTYEETIQWLQSKGARICMATFPLSPIYLNSLETHPSLNERKLRDQMLDKFRSIADHYGATYVDHQNSRDSLANFRDVDHLNSKAIGAYSKQLHQACFP